MQRRSFLGLAGSLSLFTLLGSQSQFASGNASDDVGVASGDPVPNGFVLWTRIPKAFQDYTVASQEVCCQVSTSPEFQAQDIVFERTVHTQAESDFTVKLCAENLAAFTPYFYRFTTPTGYSSVVGRARTAPALGTSVDSLKLAYLSCQDFTAGLYGVYAALANDDVHYCVHLGDTIYEHGSSHNKLGPTRIDLIGGGEAKTLEEYRAKYKLYLTDPAFREARRLFTWICLPDDHEVRNDYSGLDPALAQRRAGAYQAYFEFNPLNASLFQNGSATFQRRIDLGALASLYALDERQYRDLPPCKSSYLTKTCAERERTNRTMLGAAQFAQLQNDLVQNPAHYKILLSEVMMMPFYAVKRPPEIAKNANEDILAHSLFDDKSLFADFDAWDGFPAERARLMQTLLDKNVKNVHVWTGDIHNCYAGNVFADKTPVATEIVVGSVTSAGFGEIFPLWSARAVQPLVRLSNPHIAYTDLISHMYMRVELTPTHARYDAISVPSIRTLSGKPRCTLTLFVESQKTEIVIQKSTNTAL